MDIVSRLKEFISKEQVPVTQFADNCSIPRPTLSQLLNGRNKKVSDELITKIHDAYPHLSVLWLMFGEGDMISKSNTQFSEPKNEATIDFSHNKATDSEPIIPQLEFPETFPENKPEKSSPSTTITFSPSQAKKIVNIIVYYSDNTFDSFIPNPAK